ncbi:MAG TPA: aminotransferase class I/II-fold pyridoxal phosphate-dependent enzyme [bacterium]|nr:aminotransferase class I/II-fold pyridoxal phosphate-dependent enzyme [bacterium]HOL47978.1 aminotransferase class I/II-fold pyridoxal phosphate-dependent enzyme [bacterium]HPQ19210.1 aminotransferase class I/II-fold pyridoxal phosphate-dependent enzyme [bacterium]
MKEKINKVVLNLKPSGIRKFFDLLIGMKDVISLGVGEPDFSTPWHIRKVMIEGLENEMTMYTSNLGLLELRQEIANYYKRTFNLDYVAENQVLVTVGVSEGLDLAFRAIINPGDEILIPSPSYVSYEPNVLLCGGVPVKIYSYFENKFKPSIEEIRKKITKKTKAILLAYPNNPTGMSFTKEELIEIAEIAKENDLIVLSDEIYSQLTYEINHTTIAALPDMKERTIILNGFSKSHAMTGARIGYAIGQVDIIAAMMKIHQYTILCAPTISQLGAIEALRNGEKERIKMRDTYKIRRNYIVEQFNKLGFECHLPEGAFYIFPSIRKFKIHSEEFAKRLLEEEKVAVVPGTAFCDEEIGKDFIRCAYATDIELIKKAVERIERFLKRL